MNKTFRRLTALVAAGALVLCTSGCGWMLTGAPNLWLTPKLASGTQSRGQDMNYMMHPEQSVERGGW